MRSSTETDGRIIGVFSKNARERVIAVLHSYKGHDLLGLRVQWRTGEDDLEWKWSTKGLTISVSKIGDLMVLLQKAMALVSQSTGSAA